jgi:hypothetical protein
MTCNIVDHGTDWRCETHDVLVDQEWPDAMTTTPTAADFRCPVAEEGPL